MTPNPTPETPRPPEGYRVIPKEWINAGNRLPMDAIFRSIATAWKPSNLSGQTTVIEPQERVFYATREPLPCFTPPQPESGASQAGAVCPPCNCAGLDDAGGSTWQCGLIAKEALTPNPGASLLAELARLRAEKEEAVEKEQARWQDELDKLFAHLVPDAQIDGGGCDSGDPMDFSMSEISQALVYVIDQRDAAIAQRDQALAVARADADRLDFMEKQLTTGSGMIAHNLWHGKSLRQDIDEQMAAAALTLNQPQGEGK